MSTFRIPLTKVLEVLPHPNAHSLSIYKVYDFYVIGGLNQYKTGDKVIYVPIDSVLPDNLEKKLFPEGSKIKLTNSRVRQIKIRGSISQGMLINPKDVIFPPGEEAGFDDIKLEDDLSKQLGITKYEPPIKSLPSHMGVKTSKKVQNPNFKKYTEIENIKWYDRIFQDGEMVYISEKLHGTSSRFGWVKNEPNTPFKKFINIFGLLPKWEFAWGSKNVQIQNKLYHKGYYEEDVYTKMVKQYDLKTVIPKGYAVYGEIVGSGIQAHYDYNCKPGEHKLFVYDIMKDGKYLDYKEFVDTMEEWKAWELALEEDCILKRVPELYVGPYSKEVLDKFVKGDSTITGQKIREGIVVKPLKEKNSPTIGRIILKHINPDYLEIKDGTDFH